MKPLKLQTEPPLVQLPLRNRGPMTEPCAWPADADHGSPRALRSLSKIISEDLCHRCGSCVGICPTGVLGLDEEEYPVIKNLSACTDCDLCVKVCPGDELNVPSIAGQHFGYVPDPKDMHGHFENCYLAFAQDEKLRQDSTSGGLITALLIHMLERGEIDGALVVGSHDHEKWKGKPFIARTKAELLSTAKSKYAIAPTNVEFEEIRRVPGKYAIVGLPCQIHGFHKAARLDRKIKERVVLTIGIFCHAAIEHEPMRFLWRKALDRYGEVERFVSRVGKHPGTPHLQFKDGTYRPLYFPEATGFRPSSMEILNILYRMYTPARCLTCYDATSEFADIAVGDPWLAPPGDDVNFLDGYSFVMSRTERGGQALRQAEELGAIVLRWVEPEIARNCNKTMGHEKRERAFRIIETHRRQGKAVPDYGFDIPHLSGKQLVLTELSLMTHLFCFVKRGRLKILRAVFSPLGYYVLWINHKRRSLRRWRQIKRAKFRRRRAAAASQ